MNGIVDRRDFGRALGDAWSRSRAALALAACLCLGAGAVLPQAGGGTTSGSKDCFAEYVEDLKQCEREFSHGLFAGPTKRQLLAACIDGAKAAFKDCLKSP